MATIEAIKATGGVYTTPQAWENARGGSDITGDSNAPYIGELYGETYTGDLDVAGGTFDSTHYLHLRANSSYPYDGTAAGAPTYPVISGKVRVYDEYFRLESLAIVTTDSIAALLHTGSSYTRIDRCYIRVNYSVSSGSNISANGVSVSPGIAGVELWNNVIRVTGRNTLSKNGGNATANGIYINTTSAVYLYHNVIDDITATASDGSAYAYGMNFAAASSGYCYHNIVGDLSAATSTACYTGTAPSTGSDYNAGTDATSPGANSVDNITRANEFSGATDWHLATGYDCEDAGTDISGHSNAPAYDIDAQSWSASPNLGIDEHVVAGSTYTGSGSLEVPAATASGTGTYDVTVITETIQASGGDHATPQDWYDAHSGDLTTQARRYVGQLAAETFTNVDMSGSTCDATRYFELTAQSGAEFTGDFAGSYPILSTINATHDAYVYCTDNYCRFSHFVVGDESHSLARNEASGFKISNSTGGACRVDSCGVWKIVLSDTDTAVTLTGIDVTGGVSPEIWNNALGDLFSDNLQAAGDAYLYAIKVVAADPGTQDYGIFNNTAYGLTCAAPTSGSASAFGIHYDSVSGHTAYVANNAVMYITTTDSYTCIYHDGAGSTSQDYNATADDSTGPNGQEWITDAQAATELEDTAAAATYDFHLGGSPTIGYLGDNGLNLTDQGYSINYPTEDIDNETYPASGSIWSIGLDYAEPTGPTVESIQSDGLGHYTTPTAWYLARGGNIVTDPLAPYIGELSPESHGFLTMYGSTTSATHYLHLRAQSGYEFHGNFGANNFPWLTCLTIRDAHVRCEHFAVGPYSPGEYDNFYGVMLDERADYVLLDTIGVHRITLQYSEEISQSTLVGIRIGGSPTGVVIRNCAIGGLMAHNYYDLGNVPFHVVGIECATTSDIYVYGNSVHDLTAASEGSTQCQATGIKVYGDTQTKIYNNAIGTLAAGSTYGVRDFSAGPADIDYNATMDGSGGSHDIVITSPEKVFSNVTGDIADYDFHLKTTGVCFEAGHDVSGFDNAPTEDCDDETIGATWSVGIDYVGADDTDTPWWLYGPQQ